MRLPLQRVVLVAVRCGRGRASSGHEDELVSGEHGAQMTTTYNKRQDAAHERDTTRYRVRQLWDSMRVPRARRTRGVVAQATSRVVWARGTDRT